MKREAESMVVLLRAQPMRIKLIFNFEPGEFLCLLTGFIDFLFW